MRRAVLLAAPLAAAQHKSNWAPGYRTAGNATTINDGEAEETWAAYDHHYEAPNGWELQPFAYQAPDRYTGWYAERRSKCKWSSPISVFAHTKKYLRSTYGGAFTGSKWKSRNMYNQWSQSSLEATVCTQTWEQDGIKYQLDITRLGPIILNPGKIINTFFVPAAPLDDDMAYLVEAVDGYLDDNLKPLSYPPVHPHHSAVYVSGFPEKLAYNNPKSPFFGFNPIARLPISAMNEQGKGGQGDDWFQTSTNTPGFNNDLYGCDPHLEDQATPCYYAKVPAGYGFPRYKGEDHWANSVLEHVPPGGARKVIYEYGRVHTSNKQLKPVHILDFGVGGDGALYDTKGDGVAWFTYRMPVSGVFTSSWFHTHPVAPSDFWVLDVDAEKVLPPELVRSCTSCSSRNVIGRLHRNWASNNSGTCERDVPLSSLGLTRSQLMRRMLDDHSKHLRCWWRTRTAYSPSADRFYGRTPLRHKDYTGCDQWRFEKGQVVSLIAFNGPVPPQVLAAVPPSVRKRGAFPQHHRWWPAAVLDFPFEEYYGALATGGARTASSRFWGVSWDRKGKKWQAQYRDADGKQHTIGRFDDEEEAARAVNKAIRDAGLEGRRKTNAVDATGELVPREHLRRLDHSAVVAPDAVRTRTVATSKFWGVTWNKEKRRWRARYIDADGKTRYIGHFDTQEQAAHAVNAAIRRAGLEGKRRTNPVVDGQLVPRETHNRGGGKRRREEPAAATPTRALRPRRAVSYKEDPGFEL